MGVLRVASPDRRNWDHVGEVQRRDRRLPDVGVDMARQRSEPSFNRVDALGNTSEVAALDELLDQSQLLGRYIGVFVPHRDGRGDIGLSDIVVAELL